MDNVYVIIPNYNGIEHLEICLDSLSNQTYSNFKIIIVDNFSQDNSINFIESNYPDVEIIKLKSNNGFAKAVNIGIKSALENEGCEFVLLLNNDVECDKFFIEELLKGFINKSIGSVMSKMLYFYNRNIIDDTGDFIKNMNYPHRRGGDKIDAEKYNSPGYIFSPSAGASVYKKEVFSIVGFLDEDFFAYYEDVDLGFRMQLYGFKSYYNPKAICYHKCGATSSKMSGFKLFLMERNLTSLIIKNYPLFLIIKYFFTSSFIRFKGYTGLLLKGRFKDLQYSLKGFISGIFEIPKSLKKRIAIQKNRKVDYKYIDSFSKNNLNFD